MKQETPLVRVGIPCPSRHGEDVNPSTFFIRMTPTSAQDYVIWGISAVLIGMISALAWLYPTRTSQDGTGTGRALFGTFLSFLSVGCPICNKLVVLLLGLSGAMTFFNPLRPFLGIASIVLLGVTLFLRVRVVRSGCPTTMKNLFLPTKFS